MFARVFGGVHLATVDVALHGERASGIAYVTVGTTLRQNYGLDAEFILSRAIPLFVEHQLKILPRDIQDIVVDAIAEYLDLYNQGGQLWNPKANGAYPKLADIKVEVYVGRALYVLVHPKFHSIQAEPAMGMALYHSVYDQLYRLPPARAADLAFFLTYALHKWRVSRPSMTTQTWDLSDIQGMIEEAKAQGWW